MFIEERLEEILNILNKTGRVKVKELSKKFNVSEGMIRKDLQKLEKTHPIKRTYGGAILDRQISIYTPLNTRLNTNLTNKEIIAKKAFDVINNGDIIFLDTSSINFLLAKLIADSTKNITLITNMPIIPTLFNNNETVTLICVGGVYDKKSGSLLGSEVIKNIEKYKFNKSFIGSSGVNLLNHKVCTINLEDGNVKEAIISHSKEAFLVIEDAKFNVDSTYAFAELEDFYSIVTNSNLDTNIKEKLNKLNIKLF
ncbi:DeoR/GlpR family DNA-binding transcription regulator [Clostridium sp. MB40-C1]|uniref:DeoR/GlpR family DNA-binding transcription regulator n=1 Tax=Clostridium sp. MB40-C1 TaxID=3070996 RepID=UPI0027E009B4|nr:DeoR/GlpR family DNA-binding transcription regulator [Clostridium sp. MB40-C1]WMJ80710.1 DeoR/GlpR family DNA-binding transcription regulator [Clostridium sp. MB40-C1]